MTISAQKLISSRLTFWALITIVGGYFLYNIKHYVNFGIDLVGGTYITLQVQVEKALELDLVEKMKSLTELLEKEGQPVPVERTICDRTAIMNFASVEDAKKATSYLLTRDPKSLIEQTETKVRISLSPDQIQALEQNAVESNIVALNNRMNQFGVGEILIAPQGTNRIIVELPNVHNPQEAKAMIGRAALLEFRLVEDAAQSKEALEEKYSGLLPEGTEILPGKSDKEFYLVSKYSDVTGRLLKTARQDWDQNGLNATVNFEFKSEGADRFYELTSNNIGRLLAVVIDGQVVSAAVIQSAIGGSGQISGKFSVPEAQQLAMLLRSGAFVAPVTFEEERSIGPSLGAESIRQGLVACGVALLLLLLFSVVTYKMSGLLAFIVLLYNILLTLIMLWALGATLTLPGIAGIILTVGMAIDASILIYERMREVLAEGGTFRAAVHEGFSGAFAVIMDSNITNLLIAVVLYKLGSGPIQGFAVTMIVGIIATLITGLWMLKSFFTFALDVLGINKISI
jgi:preprotein translocase subunit SecD